ncbi:divalent-cation tolerance protein CutA [bacterium]|nr:divalent-cation tolerance protein CutA [bacterium]
MFNCQSIEMNDIFLGKIGAEDWDMQKAVFLYVTFSSEAQALEIIEQLLERRLVACANLFPARSVYKWENMMQKAEETVALLKTLPERSTQVVHLIQKLHAYQVPCIAQANVEVTPSFGEWLSKECA